MVWMLRTLTAQLIHHIFIKMAKKLILNVALAAMIVLLAMFGPGVAAQGQTESLFIVGMTGVDDSFLVIGSNVSDSFLIINSAITEIQLTGVRIYPISCSFGLIRPSDIRYTGLAFELYNASNLTMDVTIAVSGDWHGASNWTHSDSCQPGVDLVGLVAIVQTGGSHVAVIVKKTQPYNYIATDLAPGQRCAFGLQMYAPTEFSDYSKKYNNIFITTEES